MSLAIGLTMETNLPGKGRNNIRLQLNWMLFTASDTFPEFVHHL